MTVEKLSESIRQRSKLDSVKGDETSEKDHHSKELVWTKMALINTRCCYLHKWKIFGTLVGFILIGGLIAFIAVAIYYFMPKSFEVVCLRFTKSTTCLSSDPLPYRHFGTKTDYNVARSELIAPPPSMNSGCEPVHFYLLSRHAIRFPDAEDIEEMGRILPELRSKMKNSNICAADVAKLKLWKLQMTVKDDNHISETGVRQAKEIAKRFQKMFPTLLSDPYKSALYEFVITSKPRTKETAAAFAAGLFKKELPEILYPANDYVLHFNKNCTEILKRKGYKEDKAPEVKKFKTGSLMKVTLADVSARIGINLTFDDAQQMLRACAFDFVLNQNKSSPWCAAFHKNNIRVMEYYGDLDDYYDDTYGNPRNAQQACPLINDMVQQIRKAVNGTPRKALLYFSHAGVLKKVFAHLGLFKSPHQFTAERFCNNIPRKWRSSLICPFNANLAIVLYSCAGKYYVQAYVQEKPVILEGCQETMCPWTDFERKYTGTSENCILENICVP